MEIQKKKTWPRFITYVWSFGYLCLNLIDNTDTRTYLLDYTNLVHYKYFIDIISFCGLVIFNENIYFIER